MDEQYLALDFGGTFTKYALIDGSSRIQQQGKVPSACDGLEQMLASVESLKERFRGQFQGVAVSMPGRIDMARGIAHTGGNFRFIKDTPIRQELEQRFGVPVTVANDGKCAASAEAWNGALADVADGVVIVLGTGTGGGLVLDHQVRLGHTFGAGELSLFGVDLKQLSEGIPDLSCSTQAVWVDYMSATGLLKLYAACKGQKEVLPGMDGLAFFAAYDQGEPEAKEALELFGRYAAAGIYSIQSILDVQRFAIGGGISARPEVTQTIRRWVDAQFASIPFTSFGKPEVVQCHYGNDANLIGAVSFYLKYR